MRPDVIVTVRVSTRTALALLVLLLLPQPGAAGEPAEEPGITWPELVSEMERVHPVMKAARRGMSEAFSARDWADLGYLPQLSIEAGGMPSPDVQEDTFDIDWTKWGYYWQVKLRLTQPIYTFGQIDALQEQAAWGSELAKAAVDLARWELRYSAAQAYFGRQYALEVRSIIEEGHKWLAKVEERMERLKREDSDDYDQLEHLRLKTRIAEFYELEAKFKTGDTQSREGLRVLLDKPEGTEVRLASETLAPVKYDFLPVGRYVELAERNQPELVMARAGAKMRHAVADEKESGLWPRIAFMAELYLEDSSVLKLDDPETSNIKDALPVKLGFVVRWNLSLPSTLANAHKERALAIKEETKAAEIWAKQEIEIHRIWQELANKRELIKVYRRSKKAAQGWLTANWDLYDTGFGTFRDVLDSLVQFYSKKQAYLQTIFDHNVLVYELSRAVGADITTLKADDQPAAWRTEPLLRGGP